MRVPTGDVNRKNLNLHHAINITDSFMRDSVERGEMWDLIDPDDKSVRETMPARTFKQQILEVRYRTGEPYLNFIDTANANSSSYNEGKGFKDTWFKSM